MKTGCEGVLTVETPKISPKNFSSNTVILKKCLQANPTVCSKTLTMVYPADWQSTKRGKTTQIRASVINQACTRTCIVLRRVKVIRNGWATHKQFDVLTIMPYTISVAEVANFNRGGDQIFFFQMSVSVPAGGFVLHYGSVHKRRRFWY